MEPILVAERYTHGVRLSGYTRDTLYKMQGFLESLSLKEPRKIPGRGMIMELKKKYYGITEDHKQIFIHRNCLKDLISWLGNKNVPEERIKIVDIPVPGFVKASYEMLPQYVLRDYQEIICEDILRDWLHSARVDLQTGKEKLSPV